MYILNKILLGTKPVWDRNKASIPLWFKPTTTGFLWLKLASQNQHHMHMWLGHQLAPVKVNAQSCLCLCRGYQYFTVLIKFVPPQKKTTKKQQQNNNKTCDILQRMKYKFPRLDSGWVEWRQWSWPSIKVRVCRLFGTKLMHELMLFYFNEISFESLIFSFTEMGWKMLSPWS